MAKGEYIWFIGDDDLLVPGAIKYLLRLIKRNSAFDFFWVNTFHLNANYMNDFRKPFDIKYLPKKWNLIQK